MVIDDDASVITLLESALRKRGYAVVSASDAFTAAQACAREKPDLVLLDFVLPAADGRIMLDRIRALPGLEKVPVLVITGAVLADVMARLPDRGLRFIEKPFDMALLDRLMNELLGARAVSQLPAPDVAKLPPIPPLPPPSRLPPPPLQAGDDEPGSGSGEMLDLDA
jgi:two-component system response regulator VicR